MECNKDEATRARDIAEKKFTARDLGAAKKFALKAQNLYPGLEGIQQMLATLDVYISAENKTSGEADWYGILNVNPQADDDTVRKQYRKLALMLHPDKNKSIGAEGAFKLISEAWSLLSDKAKRVAYDQKRNTRVLQQKVQPPGGGPSAPPGANGFFNFTKTTTSTVRTQKTTARPPSAPKPKANTFWTVCHRCKMQYEYLRVYLNHNLLCPNCHEPFFAVETAPPHTNGSKPSTQWNFSQQQNSSHKATGKNTSNPGKNNAASDSFSHTDFQWGPFSRTPGATSAAQAATVVQQAYEKVKREREQAQAATKREEALKRKSHARKTGGVSSAGFSNAVKRRRGMDDASTSSYRRDNSNQMGTGSGGAGAANLSGFRQGNFETGRVNGINKPNGTRDVSQLEIQSILTGKARMEIRKKLNEWNLASSSQTAAIVEEGDGNEKANDKENEKKNPSVNGSTCDHTRAGESVDTKSGVRSFNSLAGTTGSIPNTETLESMSMKVPDPDFHDFDKDRTERSFGDNQVWSAYDDDDGMPRYYAMIHNVISANPFKMWISWLNSKTNSEIGPLNWIGSGFSKTCGDFRIGKYEINSSLNSFSHKVRWAKGTRGAIRIFPRKGDVWALYRNWSPDWNELTADEVIHKYDMVEVLEDYNEEVGVTVTPLVKVAGFKTVFHRHLDLRQARMIPREELFRFSHHVPSYLLTGQEAPNAPKGCRELDPAATPLELLHIIIDVKEEDTLEIEETKNQNTVDSFEKPNDTEMVENSEKARREEISGNFMDTQHVEIVEDTKEIKKDEKGEHSEKSREEEISGNFKDIQVVEIE